jgi:NADH:ubiquinone oxidoreductase subunit 2 (subunit N)
MNENLLSLTYFIPETILGVGVLAYLLALTFIKSSKIIAGFAYVILGLVLASLVPQVMVQSAYPVFHHLLEINFLNAVFRILAVVMALIWSCCVFRTRDREDQAGVTMVFFILTALLG